MTDRRKHYEVRILDAKRIESDFLAIYGYPIHDAPSGAYRTALAIKSERYWKSYNVERFARARALAQTEVEADFDGKPQIIRWVGDDPHAVWKIDADGEIELIHGDPR
jgi:hypothetical protein